MGRKAKNQKNNKKPGAQPVNASKKPSLSEIKQKNELKAKRVKLSLIIFAIVALVSILVTVAAVLIVNYNKNRTIDYLNDDLSKYVYISEELYKNFPAEIYVDPITNDDVETAFIRKLCEYKSRNAYLGGQYLTNEKIDVGHIVYMKYRGYTLDANNNRVYFDGGCNFTETQDSNIAQEIGSKDKPLYTGFELGLIGKNPADYARLEERTSGTVKAGSVISITYNVFCADGTTKKDVSAIVGLNDSNIEQLYGDGFSEFFIGKKIGEELEESCVAQRPDDNGIQTMYTDIKINSMYEIIGTPLVVEAYSPKSTDSEQIAGKTVRFEVFVSKTQRYDAPAADDAFITDKLQLSAESLSEYEGNSLVEKYKSKLREELTVALSDNKKAQIEQIMWDYYNEKATVKELPSFEVNRYYNNYVFELETQYKNYNAESTYGSFDAFVTEMLELDENESWQDALVERAEKSVREKLIFYYIITKEGLLPSEEEYNRLYEQSIDEHVTAYMENTYDEDDFNTDEEYNQRYNQARAEIIDYYGEDYFKENVYFFYAVDTLVGYANIIEK